MTLYYLGMEVVLLEEHGDGWCLTRSPTEPTKQWPEGRECRQWRAQLYTEPFGLDTGQGIVLT